MAIIIERKFLVNDAAFQAAKNLKPDTFEETIEQGYLFNGRSRTIRIRIQNSKGVLTFKGARSIGGMARNEVRLTIPLSLAKLAIKLVGKTITKSRTYIRYDDVDWVVDKYKDGTMVGKAKVDMLYKDIILPCWALEEVTGVPEYFTSNLIKQAHLQ
jgi:CYTH domain-containing protein